MWGGGEDRREGSSNHPYAGHSVTVAGERREVWDAGATRRV